MVLYTVILGRNCECQDVTLLSLFLKGCISNSSVILKTVLVSILNLTCVSEFTAVVFLTHVIASSAASASGI